MGNIINHTTTFKKNLRNIIKVRVQENQIGNLTSRWISLSHHDRTIRLTKGENIIDSVSCHSCCMPRFFQCLDNEFLLMRGNTSENSCLLSHSNQFLIRDFRAIYIAMIVRKTSLLGNTGHRNWIVTRDDLETHFLRTEIVQRLCCSLSNRIQDFQQGQSLNIRWFLWLVMV